jgi:hypothetical protein
VGEVVAGSCSREGRGGAGGANGQKQREGLKGGKERHRVGTREKEGGTESPRVQGPIARPRSPYSRHPDSCYRRRRIRRCAGAREALQRSAPSE